MAKGESQEAIDKQHAAGRLTARERVDFFLDEGTFVELGLFVQHQCHDFGMEKRRPYGDGVITGFGKVEGRLVYIYAQDFTVLGGTVGHSHAAKICNVMRLARRAKAPIIGLLDTGGARIQEGVSTYGPIFAENVLASGVVPQISAIMGNCAGGAVYSPALTDFIFMVEGSYMFITGPKVIEQVTGEEITMEDLGGAKTQSQSSGVCDFTARDDKDCLQQIRKLLGFLDSRYCDTGDDSNRSDNELDNIVPPNPRQPFDMHQIIYKIVDNGDFMEAKAKFARNIITGFGRLAGYCVGFIANQPLFAAGSLDSDACDKATRFYRVCDCFDIPIICLVDVPGYLPGVAEERKGIIRHGAKMLYGLREATVPKISVVIHKAYGGAYVAMGSKSIGMDMALAWPTAEIAIMGAEGAVATLYRREIQQAEDKGKLSEEKSREYKEKFSTPYYTASKQVIDAIIRPRETRPQLIRALEALRNKHESPVPRKHGNIPL